METTTGVPELSARTTSRQMASDPTAEPPGLSTRNRIPLTRLSSAASRSALVIVSDPIVAPGKGRAPNLPSPRVTAPVP